MATDNNYVGQVAVALASLVETNRDVPVVVHLLLNNVAPSGVESLRHQLRGSSVTLATYDIRDFEKRFPVKVKTTIVPVTAYARMFLQDILPKTVSSVLYVDCDVLFAEDIRRFWNEGPGNHSVLGVLDTPGAEAKTGIGLEKDAPYINSGVLLINLDYWRANDMRSRFVDYLVEHDGLVVHNDQGVINAVCADSKGIVGPEYNFQSTYYSHSYKYLARTQTPCYSREELDAGRCNPVIVHLTEGFLGRPWRQNSKHPLTGLYLKYKAQTAWADTPLEPDMRSLPLKVLSWLFLNTPLWCYNLAQGVVGALNRAGRALRH